ncbi:hypothetical protein VPH35_113883 [Triticum aestivum]
MQLLFAQAASSSTTGLPCASPRPCWCRLPHRAPRSPSRLLRSAPASRRLPRRAPARPWARTSVLRRAPTRLAFPGHPAPLWRPRVRPASASHSHARAPRLASTPSGLLASASPSPLPGRSASATNFAPATASNHLRARAPNSASRRRRRLAPLPASPRRLHPAGCPAPGPLHQLRLPVARLGPNPRLRPLRTQHRVPGPSGSGSGCSPQPADSCIPAAPRRLLPARTHSRSRRLRVVASRHTAPPPTNRRCSACEPRLGPAPRRHARSFPPPHPASSASPSPHRASSGPEHRGSRRRLCARPHPRCAGRGWLAP